MSKYSPITPTRDLFTQLDMVETGQADFALDPRLINLLVIGSKVVSTVMIGERVSLAALRTYTMNAKAIDDVGLVEGSLDALPKSRRRTALKAQPELRRAFAVRAMNAVCACVASGFVQSNLTYFQNGLTFPDFTTQPTARARAMLGALVPHDCVKDVVIDMIATADGFEPDLQRWDAAVGVARHLVSNHCMSDTAGEVAKRLLLAAPDRPLNRLRHPELEPLLNCLTLAGSDTDRGVAILTLHDTERSAAQQRLKDG